MSYLLAETGGLLLASMILGCALGYLIGAVRRAKVPNDEFAPAMATSAAGHPMAADDRVVYEDNLRRARSEIVRLEKQNNRMTSALEAARAVPASAGAVSGVSSVDRWEAVSAETNDNRTAELEAELSQRDQDLAELAELRERNEQVEDALAVREHEIEELEESVRVMHQRVLDAEAEAEGAQRDATADAPLFGAAAFAGTASESDPAETEQLRTELEHARARLVRLDERQLELDQLVTRLRGPAARAERLEVETGRLRDRLRLREARLRHLEQGLAETGLRANQSDQSRGGATARRSGRRVRASRTDQMVTGRRSSASAGNSGDSSGDLTRIDGIGPVLARMLDQRGVSSLSDLAELSDTDITNLETQLPEFATRIRRDRWVEQAQQMLSKRNTR